MNRSRTLFVYAPLVLAMSTIVLLAAQTELRGVRVITTVGLLGFGTGAALVHRWLPSIAAESAIGAIAAIGISIGVTILVSEAMLLSRLWYPRIAVVVIGSITMALSAAEIGSHQSARSPAGQVAG